MKENELPAVDMSNDDIKKEKQAMRDEIAAKIAAGQTFNEHFKENSAFDEELIKESKITMIIEGEEIVIYPESAKDNKDEKKVIKPDKQTK